MLAKTCIWLIDRYQRRGGGDRLLVSCNFTPSCSHYAKEAIQELGFRRAFPVIRDRLKRCNDPACLHPRPDPFVKPGDCCHEKP